MIRLLLAIVLIAAAGVLAPIAASDAAMNSADFLVAASPLALLCILWPPLRPRRPRRSRAPWIADIPASHPDALGSLDRRERYGPPTD